MSLSPVNVVIEDPPSRATLESLGRGLDAYNALHSPSHAEEFVVALRADDGALQGGIRAEAWAGMLFVRWVWLQERQRGLGHGRALMREAEAEGRRRGCTRVWLDTFEFQARPFYEKLGYECFGELAYPAGFKRFFLQKAL